MKALIKGKALLAVIRSSLNGLLPSLVGAGGLSSRRIAPKESVIKVLTAVWFMLGYRKEALGDAGSTDPTAFSWRVARTSCLNSSFVSKLQAFDPEAPATMLAYQKSDLLKATLAEASAEDLAKTGAVMPVLAAWAKAALDVKEAAIAKRKREAEEAAAKAAAEAEAAAAAKAAAEGGE